MCLYFSECLENGFKCTAGNCIPSHQVCDGLANCNDLSDETNCSKLLDTEGLITSTCLNSADRSKIYIHHVVKSLIHVSAACPDNFFRCDNHRCLPPSKQCDGFNDCGDVSDEKSCGK